jgi:excisionase family DNA binding protein
MASGASRVSENGSPLADVLTLALPAATFEAIIAAVTEQVLERLKVEATPASPFVTVDEAAELLRTSRGRIDNLLSAGKLTRVKEGRRTLILRAEIDAYLRRNERRNPF